jgi:hypothetical protein
MASERLAGELATYEAHREELVGSHDGQFVLIHGDEIAGIWDTYKDAIEAGYQRFKLEPFLVKQIQSIERVQFITRDILACPFSPSPSTPTAQ